MLHSDCAYSERAYEGFFEGASATLYGAGILHVERQYRIYSSTEEYVILSSDSLATQPFNGTLLQPLQITRSLLGSDIIGQFTAGNGKITLTNADGEYDYLIQRFAIDGRDIEVKVGNQDSYDEFFTIFKGTASDWSVEEDVVQIDVVDNAYRLSVPVQENTYGGTGGTDGTSDLIGKRKPLCYGYALNISPPLVIPSSLVYQVHDDKVYEIIVYDRGVTLTWSGDYSTDAALIASVPGAGCFTRNLNTGLFKLGSTPSGTITADVRGDYDGVTLFSSTADIVRRVLARSVLVDPDDLYLPSFSAVNAANNSEVGYYVGPDDTTTIADVVAHLMHGIGGWGGFRRSGKFELGIFSTPTGALPAAHFDKTDIFDIKREKLPTSMSPPPYRFRVGWQHNWTVQTDLAGSVSATRRSFLSEENRYSEATDSSIKTDHPFAQDREPIASFFRDQVDAQTEANRLLDLYRGTKALYRFTVGIQPFALDLGDVVNITYPRWDLIFGRNVRIVEMSENAQNNTIELVGYG